MKRNPLVAGLIAGGIALVLLIVVGGGCAILFSRGASLSDEGERYVSRAIPAISSHWDVQEFQKHTSPEFNAATSPNDTKKLLAACKRLGKLRRLRTSQGNFNVMYTAQEGKVVTAVYVVHADFEGGPATINITLTKHKEKWQIAGFYVSSLALLGK